jgi:hypothetical protein
MLREEAQWLSECINSLNAEQLFPVLNIGSSNQHFREQEQPWIDDLLFKPLTRKAGLVIHTDIKPDAGVDIAGDLNDSEFLEKLSDLNIKSVLCSNLLEHITERERICRSISSLIPVDGYLLVTVPYRFPLHGDPVDTLFRPDIKTLEACFPELEVVQAKIVESDRLFRTVSTPPLLYLTVMLIRVLCPFYQPMKWLDSVRYSLWLFTKVSVTCMVLKKV